MPRRDDINKILVDRLRADRHRPGLRVRLLGCAGLQGASGGRLRGRAREQQSGHDHDRSGSCGANLCRADHARVRREGHRCRAPRRATADVGRPDRPELRDVTARAWRSRALRRRAHRCERRGHQEGRGPQALRRGDGTNRARRSPWRLRVLSGRRRGARGRPGPSGGDPPVVHDGRRGGRHRVQRRGAARHRDARAGPLARDRGAGGGVRHRLERVRDGGHARPQRQRGHRVLDRELRCDGRAHG